MLRGAKSLLRPIDETDLALLWKWENDSELTYFLNADRHRVDVDGRGESALPTDSQ